MNQKTTKFPPIDALKGGDDKTVIEKADSAGRIGFGALSDYMAVKGVGNAKDAIDKGEGVEAVKGAYDISKFTLGKGGKAIKYAGETVGLNATKEVGRKAGKKISEVGTKLTKASAGMEKVGAVPVGDAFTIAKGVQDWQSGEMSGFKTEDQQLASAAGMGAAALNIGGALTGIGGVSAGVAAAGSAAAGGAGLMSAVGTGRLAAGPIGWAGLAIGGVGLALGLGGAKSIKGTQFDKF